MTQSDVHDLTLSAEQEIEGKQKMLYVNAVQAIKQGAPDPNGML